MMGRKDGGKEETKGMKAVTHIEGKLKVDRQPYEPTSIEIRGVDIITLLEAYNGQKVEIQIRLKEEG